MTTLKARIQQLESRNAQTALMKEYPEECICFPDNDPDELPAHGFEADAAARVPCPLHGKRFENFSRALYRARYILRRQWDFGFSGRSEQYKKATRATFHGNPDEIYVPTEPTSL